LKTAIVILNYNGVDHLRRFLPSVVKHSPEDARIVVADNASTDESIKVIQNDFPSVELIQLDENYGFTGGYNRALRQIIAELYVLLNNDVEVTENWLEPVLDAFEKRPEMAACQPKIKSWKEKDYFEYAGACGGFIDKNGFLFCRGRIFNHTERDIGQHDDEREVFWASGACLFIRSKAFHENGGFNETLFAHMEEVDLCWRIKNQGHEIYCIPASTVYHLGGGTLSAQSSRKTYLNFRNNLSIIVRNDFRGNLASKIFKRMIFDGAAAWFMLFSSGPSHFFAVLRAHAYFYLNLNRLLRERKELHEKVVTSNMTGKYRGSIVQDFYKDKKRVFGALASNLFTRHRRTTKSSAIL
jgi:GT2 family glycosyltransferase